MSSSRRSTSSSNPRRACSPSHRGTASTSSTTTFSRRAFRRTPPSTSRQKPRRTTTGGDGVAALVVTTGGVGTYPAVVSSRSSSSSVVDTAFHEWTHNYLSFYPLGSSYFEGDDLRTLNESVADLAGRELARLYFERYEELRAPAPAQATSPEPSQTPDPGDEPFDFTAEMRALRVEVEALLADGKITEAEALMDEKRDEFEEKGHHVREINQAYFAFYGFYGDSPASISPIGNKIDDLFEQAGSVGEFSAAHPA